MGILGSIGSFLFGGKKKQSQQKAESQQNFTVNPYGPTLPYIEDYLSENRDLYSSTPQFSADELAGYDYLRQNVANNTGAPSSGQNAGLMALIASMGASPQMLAGLDQISGAQGAHPGMTAGYQTLLDANGGNAAADQGLFDIARAARTNPAQRMGIQDIIRAANGPGINNEMTFNGLNAVNNLNGGPSGYTDTSEATLRDTAGGKFLTPDTNPYLKDIAGRISGMAGANVQAMFGGRGRTGSGLAGQSAGKAVTDSLTDMYGQVYESERGRQQQAALGAPAFDATKAQTASNIATTKFNTGMNFGAAQNAQDMGNASALFSAGNTQQNQALNAGNALFSAGNTATDQKLRTGQAVYGAGQGIQDQILKAGQSLFSAGGALTDMNRSGAQGVFDASSALEQQKNTTGMNNAQALISAGQNISARPYDISGQYGNILANIAKLGSSGQSEGTSKQVNYTQSPGLIGGIFNSFVNKLFGTGFNTGG